MTSTKESAIVADNASDAYIEDACDMSNSRFHKYYIEYKKQDKVGSERWNNMWREKQCSILDIIYWTFDDWRFNYNMRELKQEFIQLYGKEQLPISQFKIGIRTPQEIVRFNNHTL